MADELDIASLKPKKTIFDEIRQVNERGEEYWSARDLMVELDYKSWQIFEPLIHRAAESLRITGGNVDNHFMAGHKMVAIGYGNERRVKDYNLSRLASYLVAMTGDGDQKKRVAEAQGYFAQKTRLREISEANESDLERLKERNKYTDSDRQLSSAVMEVGISARGLAKIKSDGDKVFFGGNDTEDMKTKYAMPLAKPLADKMPNVLLSAKGLTNQMTKYKIENSGLYGVDAIDEVHSDHSQSIRDTLINEGMTPEELPPEEDTKLIKRRIESSGDINNEILA
ncbi:MAG TPA: hypothetical protein VK502_01425 [Candidatus Saccharimonadales bacterium]|nr:hypothetical protein [Candidatus Saccharimonadales bacterium]